MKYRFAALLLIIATTLGASEIINLSLPGINEQVQLIVQDNGYIMNIPHLGYYEVQGHYDSPRNFSFTTTIPIDKVAGMLPYVGTLLTYAGLSSTDVTITHRGMGLAVNFQDGGLGALRGDVTELLSQVPELKAFIDAFINTFALQSLTLSGRFNGDQLFGEIHGVMSVVNQEFPFQTRGNLSFQSMMNDISGVMLSGPVTDAMETMLEWLEHVDHEYEYCYEVCVPEYSAPLSASLTERSNRTVFEFFAKEAHWTNLTKDIAEQERRLRGPWEQLIKELDAAYGRAYDDETVRNFFTVSSSAQNGFDKHVSIFQQDYNHHVLFRQEMWYYYTGSLSQFRDLTDPRDVPVFMSNYKIPLVLVHRDTSYAVTVPNAAEGSGTRIAFQQYNGGMNQIFYLRNAEYAEEYYIQSAATGKYLHINGANDRDGSPLVLWGGYGGDNTAFTVDSDGSGYLYLRTRGGHYFHLDGGYVTNGAPLTVRDEENGTAQQFSFIPASRGASTFLRAGYYRVRSYAPAQTLYLTAEDRAANGANVYLDTRQGATQEFLITGGRGVGGQPTYRFYNQRTGRYIHLQGAKFNQRTNVLLWENYGNPNARFTVHRTDDHSRFVINTPWGYIFEGQGQPNAVRAGANVFLYTDRREPDQRWEFEEIRLIE